MQAHASLCKPCSLMQPHAASCSLVQPHAASHRGKGGAHISSCYNRSIFRTNDHHQKFLVEVMMESLSDSHAEDILHGTCICMQCMQIPCTSSCSAFGGMQVLMHGTCMVFAWLHGVFAWHLHGVACICRPMQARGTASRLACHNTAFILSRPALPLACCDPSTPMDTGAVLSHCCSAAPQRRSQ